MALANEDVERCSMQFFKKRDEALEYMRERNQNEDSSNRRKVCIFFAGNSGVGKSTFCEKLVYGKSVENPIPTLAAVQHVLWAVKDSDRDHDGLASHNVQLIECVVYDMGGHDRFYTFNSLWIVKSHACFAMMSIDDQKSKEDMDMWIDRAQSISRQRNGYDLLVCKIVNKIDLDPSLHIDTQEHLLDLFNQEGVASLWTSASRSSVQSVRTFFSRIVDEVLSRMDGGCFMPKSGAIESTIPFSRSSPFSPILGEGSAYVRVTSNL